MDYLFSKRVFVSKQNLDDDFFSEISQEAFLH